MWTLTLNADNQRSFGQIMIVGIDLIWTSYLVLKNCFMFSDVDLMIMNVLCHESTEIHELVHQLILKVLIVETIFLDRLQKYRQVYLNHMKFFPQILLIQRSLFFTRQQNLMRGFICFVLFRRMQYISI
jgi:hypothetical protein